MQWTWKSVSLFALVSVAIQYVAIQTLTSSSYLMCPAPSLSRSAPSLSRSASSVNSSEEQRSGSDEEHLSSSTRKTHVLILTDTRCGSSFMGQLLNQHPDVFYLFEPLYHVQASLTGTRTSKRKLVAGANRDLLWSLLQCDLYALERYIHPAPIKHMVGKLFFSSSIRALCEPPVCQAFEPNEKGGPCSKCNPVNLTRAAEYCRGQSHVAYKTVRVGIVGDLRPLMEDPRLNIKVIQLVRDPRGILSSRITAFEASYQPWRIWKATGKRPRPPLENYPPPFTSTCDDFYTSVSTALSQPDWLRGRYMLVRYEDLSRSPLQKTKEIYDFVGLTMTPGMEEWIRANTNGATNAQIKNKFSTTRDSAAHTESWRLQLPFDMVQYVQGPCQRTLRQLGYREVQSADELRNMNISLVQDKTFGPFL